MRTPITILFLLASLTTFADSKLHNLDISVELHSNGDARITEVRTMDIEDKGSECYIVIENTNGSRVKDLNVTDETGLEYLNTGSWDINASRQDKACKCGIHKTDDGYEVCWGLGSQGRRVYTTSYTLTRLVRGYDEADGFCYMFVAQHIEPKPQKATVTISRADGEPFTYDETKIWSFRFAGDVFISDGSIVAQTSEALRGNDAIIVMARFEKGVFSPAKTVDGTFEELVQEPALEDSDYDDYEDEDGFGHRSSLKSSRQGIDWTALLCALAAPIIFLVVGAVIFIRRIRERRRVKRDLMWFRGIPFDGNLQHANEVMNCLRFFSVKYDNLLNAVVMRLISIGAIDVVGTADKKGRVKQQLAVRPLDEAGKRQHSLVRQVHDILWKAAGDDHILQPKELKKWIRRNKYELEGFVDTLRSAAKLKDVKKERERVRELYGLRKFLKDFTLANERHVTEVKLWNEYLVWATLFGIARQVSADMKKLNPDFAELDRVMEVMTDRNVVPAVTSSLLSSTHRVDRNIRSERASRSSGGGGAASRSGGGGYSGGGSGGGIR